MTGDRTLTLLSKKLLPISVVLAGGVALSACSSQPSPWSETSSPWEGQAEPQPDPEPLAIDEFQADQPTIEPVIEEEPVMIEPEVIEEPVVEESAVVAGSLAQQPSDMFVVQVVASSSMDQLSFFARENQISEEWVAETTVDGRVWFVLMSGVYATKSEAEQALSGLQGLGTEPWIRRVGSVQAVMNQ